MSNPFCSDDDYPEPSAYNSSSFYTGLFKSGGPYCDSSIVDALESTPKLWAYKNNAWHPVLKALVNSNGEWV